MLRNDPRSPPPPRLGLGLGLGVGFGLGSLTLTLTLTRASMYPGDSRGSEGSRPSSETVSHTGRPSALPA